MKIDLISITPNAEGIIEAAARTCYQSEHNPNRPSLIPQLIKNGHESVLEHGSASFKISGISRALTHQLVRHRLCSFSQQSQRYVREDGFEYIVPPSIIKIGKEKEFIKQMENIQEMYTYWKNLGIRNEDARYVLPNACSTKLVITANMREYRTIIKLRCEKHAQWEIRSLFIEILNILSQKCPNIFMDLKQEFITLNTITPE